MDHYQTLGILRSAEGAVVKAAYRALTSIYHPDKNKDPGAALKMQSINASYAVLSDTQKRGAYDSSLELSDAEVDASDFAAEKPFKEDPLHEKWEIAVRFNPAIDLYFKRLEKLSWMLGFFYKIQLLETQDFRNSLTLSQELRFQYLSKYFGKNDGIINYAEEYILAKEIEAALYLNKVIVVLGASADLSQLKLEMQNKFPKSVNKIYEHSLYKKILHGDSHGNQYLSSDFATELVKRHGGTVKSSFFGKYEIIIDGEKSTHSNSSAFCEHVLSFYKKKYS